MAEVRIEVIAVDRTGGILDRLSGSTGRLAGETSALGHATSRSGEAGGRAAESMRGFAAAGGAAAVASGRVRGALGETTALIKRWAGPIAAAYGLKQMKDVAQGFQSEMANVATLVDRSDREMRDWGQDLAAMAPEVGRRARDLAGGLYQVISAIGDVPGKMEVLETSAKAATAGLTDTFTAVDIITTGLNAYGKEASEASTISDQLFTAVRLGKTTFPELAASMGQVLPFSSQLGITFGDTAAALAALTSAGLSTEIATTALRATFVSFIQNADRFKDAGVDILRVVREEGLVGGLNVLKEITGGNIEKMREFIPETRALAAALSLTGENAGKFTSAQEAMAASAGATEAAFRKQAETAEFAEAELAATFDALSIAAGETFLPAITAVVKGLTLALNKFIAFSRAVGEGAAIWVEWGENAISAIEGFGPRMYQAGRNIVNTLTEGIKSMMSAPVDAIRQILSTARDYLPFSPAKVGPLRDLDRTGPAFVRTFAQGITGSRDVLASAVSSTLDAAYGPEYTRRAGAEAARPEQLQFGSPGRAAAGGVTLRFGDIIVRASSEDDGRRVGMEIQEQIADDIRSGRSPILPVLNARFG